MQNCLPLVKLLIEVGVDPSAPTKSGQTSFDLCKQLKLPAEMEGALVDRPLTEPVFFAPGERSVTLNASRGYDEMQKLLVDRRGYHAFYNQSSMSLVVVCSQQSSADGARVGIHFGQGKCHPIRIEREQTMLYNEFADNDKDLIRLSLLGLEKRCKLEHTFREAKLITGGHFLELEARFGARPRIHVALLFGRDGPPQALTEIAKSTEASDGFWSFIERLGLEEAHGSEEDGWFRGDEAISSGR